MAGIDSRGGVWYNRINEKHAMKACGCPQAHLRGIFIFIFQEVFLTNRKVRSLVLAAGCVALGLVLPLLRNMFFGMPAALILAFEMATYGMCTGLLCKFLPKKPAYVYITLIASMLIGRAVLGVVSLIVYTARGTDFTFAVFLAGAFTNAVRGIILHIVLILPIVLALKQAKILREE